MEEKARKRRVEVEDISLLDNSNGTAGGRNEAAGARGVKGRHTSLRLRSVTN